uniref:Arginase n=1 Tax=Macrostomum lignano TaxID=282301 RepID=A0A1I8FB72_9PLAT
MQRSSSLLSSSSTYDPSTRIVREPLYKQGDHRFPTNLGQPNSGVQMGLEPSGEAACLRALSPLQVALNHQGKENILFCIGGDHSVSLGTVHGHAQVNKDMVLLWIDAHADCNTCLTSGSGNVHGMPLSFLINELQEFVPPDGGVRRAAAVDIAFIGLRDIDPGERYLLEKFGVTYYGMQEVDHLGIQEVVRRSLQEVNPGFKRPIHLSFDIDSLDPGFAKCTGTPCRPDSRCAKDSTLRRRCTGQVNPDLGDPAQSEVTVNAAKEVIRACFGWQRAGIVPSNYQIPMPADVKRRVESFSAAGEVIEICFNLLAD